ncbi:MAG: hypothetical protein H6821_00315 [Planctomycetaceae bacterium]|nr:hypothetical protein [Planctomycetales bacterium]MCB9872593.1 hypothetical protein [Planctomycetaceae bacterium]MCB9939581.1 hypothetical protein [Planctomycetaceae bacterium]
MSAKWLNPFIVGQSTLLFGAVALGLAILPQEIIREGPSPTGISDIGVQDDAVTQQRLKPYRVASMGIAIVGLCIGPIGWIRERPPLLPVSGMAMCVVALFWYWIVVGVMLAVMIFVLFAVLTSIGGAL